MSGVVLGSALSQEAIVTTQGIAKPPLSGVLTFHSETGTEGGYWAFQDEKFITKNTSRFSCKKCGLYWDKTRETEQDVLKKAERFGGSPDLKFCDASAHEFVLACSENWSYEGLHILKDGDELTIFSKDCSSVVWSGKIELTTFSLFTEHVSGLWIHADQKDVPRHIWGMWFFEEYPAFLRPAE